MQKIRIIFGRKNAARCRAEEGLKTIFGTSDFVVQGDSPAKIIEKEGRICAILFGRILGTPAESALLEPIDRCIDSLEGRFVLVRFPQENSCEVFCDRYGQMDLYYQKFEEGFVFASDLSLLPFKNSKIEYDSVAAAHALSVYGFRPAKRHTLYKGVKRLGVRESACWKNNQIHFYELPLPVSPAREYGKEDLSRYSEILLEAVAKRSSPNGNLVYLSSGWDSTAILASLVKLHGASKVRALTSRLTMSDRSGLTNPFEVERAKKVADYFGVKLETVDADWSRRGPEILERSRSMMRAHMFSGMSLYNWLVMADTVAKTGRGEAVFSGEISDGAHNLGFSQFTTLFHPVLEFREYSDKMSSYLFGPTFLQSLQKGEADSDIIYRLLKQKYPNGIFDAPAGAPAACARQLLASFFLRDVRLPLWSLKNNQTLTEWGRKLYADEMESAYLEKPSQALTPETLYAQFLHLYNSFHWQGGTVATLAATADQFGFEMQLPFWDSPLQNFLSAMPESWGRGLEMRPTKYPLKWMLEHAIDYPWHLQVGPHSYLYDVDPAFNHAVEFVYRSSFAPHIKKEFQQQGYKELLSPEVFNHAYYDRIVDHYLDGQEVLSERNDVASLAFLALTGWYSNQ